MLLRHAPLACLALLMACGGNETEPTTATSKPTAKTEMPPTTPAPPPVTDPAMTDPIPPPMQNEPGIDVLPPEPEETSPGIVHVPADVTPPVPEEPLDTAVDEGLLLDEPEASAPARAVAQLSPATGSQVTGSVTFLAAATGVEVRVQLEGLTPGKHGLHIHEKGDCSASDFASAGDHFNPTNSPHGGPDSAARHAGDFGNVEADAAGRVDATFLDPLLTLTGADTILGRAVIVHSDPDDLVTQPAGNSGTRLACGVIEEQKAPGSAAGGG
jgi:Cu-Zn family superoxide dismutase